MIILTILWICYAVAEAYEDSQYTVILNHKPTVYVRIVTGALVLHLSSPLLWTEAGGEVLKLAFILITVFWFVFELAGNLFRGNYFSYIGTTSKIDRLLKRYELPVFYLRLWLVALAYGLYYYDDLMTYATLNSPLLWRGAGGEVFNQLTV